MNRDREAAQGPVSPPKPVIEAHKAPVYRASTRDNLQRTPEERIRNLQRLAEFAAALRRAGRVARTGASR